MSGLQVRFGFMSSRSIFDKKTSSARLLSLRKEVDKKGREDKDEEKSGDEEEDEEESLTDPQGWSSSFRSGLQSPHKYSEQQKERKAQTDQALTASEWREGRNKEMPFAGHSRLGAVQQRGERRAAPLAQG